MAINFEWKACARDFDRQRQLAEAVTGSPALLLEQEDTFFRVPRGRLKLRQLAEAQGELIYYDRPDRAGPKISVYSLVPTDQPDALRELLTQALGVRAVVRKRRRLYQRGPVRIHLDEVEGLGTFVEVEVVIRPGEVAAGGEELAADLQRELEVRGEDLVEVAYVDLLEQAARGG
jgi:predicted adenylyl cyclase CyaB